MKHYFLSSWILFSAILFHGIYLNAQHEDCGTDHSPEAYERYKAIMREALHSNVAQSRNNTKYLPIRHIIVRKSDGTGGITDNNLQEAMDSLNYNFASAGIQFYECSRTYIDSTPFYELNVTGYPNASADAVQLAAMSEQANVLNVFYTNRIFRIKNNGDTSWLCGRADMPYSTSTDRVYFNYRCPHSTFAHEVGHYLGLWHTHHGYDAPLDQRERVIRQGNMANCSIKGDLLCDTPADPRLSADSMNNCIYQGLRRDFLGDLYTPMTSNFMAYGEKNCRTTFTEGQKTLMRYAVHEYTLRNDLSCNCNSIITLGSFNFNLNGSGNYQTTGNVVAVSRPNCDLDRDQVRVGNCNKYRSSISVELAVPNGIDNLRLDIKGAMLGTGSMNIYLDNTLQKTALLNCFSSIQLNNIANHTQDGRVVLKFEDPSIDCQGDFVLDHLTVKAQNCYEPAYARLPYTTNFSQGTLDPYWTTFSTNGSGRIQISPHHNPPTGGKSLLMDKDLSLSTSSGDVVNYAELRVDLSSCSGSKILVVNWNRMHPNSPYNNDEGLYFSDNGGRSFLKYWGVPNDTTWVNYTVNLNTAAQSLGLTLNNRFVIRFYSRNNNEAPHDALSIDAVSIISCLTDTYSTSQTSNSKNASSILQPAAFSFEQVQLQLYPNPAHEFINIELNELPIAATAEVKIIDMLGRIHSSTEHPFDAGNTKLQLSLGTLPTGVYTVVVQQNDHFSLSKRFVVQP